jgi:prolyl oligopeptidase
MRRFLIIAAALGATAGCSSGPADNGSAYVPTPLSYPPAPRSNRIDDFFGTPVADPYRWMEDLESEDVRDWVTAQNELSGPWLESIPVRGRIIERGRELWNFERYTTPIQRGGRFFFERNDGLQDQNVLYVTDDLERPPSVVIDPNRLSDDGTVSLSGYDVSPDGRLVAWSTSDGGTDWDEWRIRSVDRGEDYPEVLRHTKFTSASWLPDSSGFFYSRYPVGPDGNGDDSQQVRVFFHRVGTPQSDDALVYEVSDHPSRNPYARVTDDGRFLLIREFDGYDANSILIRELTEGEADIVPLFDAWDGRYTYLGNDGPRFFVLTDAGAPRGRIIAVDARAADSGHWQNLVPEGSFAIESASRVGDRLIVQYLEHAASVVRTFDLNGVAQGTVELPGLGTVDGFDGSPEHTQTFYRYTSYTTPDAIYRYDLVSGRSDLFRQARTALDTGTLATERVFYESRDGTRVPMIIVGPKAAVRDGRNPTLLYGYGGFNASQQPRYQNRFALWLDMGGTLAVANLRGGGEYGADWHAAGTKLNKQNVFDDFVAAAEYLIDEGYTSTPKLAINGRSNGGLLVGAVMTQHPNLFGAAIPVVGVLDMLRYHTPSGNARQWSSDYGLAENEDEFLALKAYSPVHNVRPGTCYPPTLIVTADRDDRVVPWHSYKFGAALQAAQGCANPILVRVETRAGHGAGKPVWMQIEEIADRYAFLHRELRM